MSDKRQRYFHGGVQDLRPGDRITPHGANPGWKRDDCPWCQSGADDSHEPTKVFITSNKTYARFYASRFGRGDLYLVQPVGDLTESDQDMGIPTWSCDQAIVLSVYDRRVELTHTERRRIWRLGGGTDYEYEQMINHLVRSEAKD